MDRQEINPADVRFCSSDFWILKRDDETFVFTHLDEKDQLVYAPFKLPELVTDTASTTVYIGRKPVLGPMADSAFIGVRAAVNKARKALS
jgi:hypothetical protein